MFLIYSSARICFVRLYVHPNPIFDMGYLLKMEQPNSVEIKFISGLVLDILCATKISYPHMNVSNETVIKCIFPWPVSGQLRHGTLLQCASRAPAIFHHPKHEKF
jgi:hypothetical protein